jgi:hypothetical protein
VGSTLLVSGGSLRTLRLNKADRSSFINLAANVRNRNARARQRELHLSGIKLCLELNCADRATGRIGGAIVGDRRCGGVAMISG